MNLPHRLAARMVGLRALLIGLALAPGFASRADQPIEPPCTPIEGTFVFSVFQFTGPTTAIGTGIVKMGGQAVGTFSADYFNIEQQGNGVTRLNGEHAITLPGGTLFTYDEILLQSDNKNPAVVRANSRLYIVGGAGAYAGATGLLHTHGAFNVSTLEGGIDFKGKVCVP
jgi:hypothetical protein